MKNTIIALIIALVSILSQDLTPYTDTDIPGEIVSLYQNLEFSPLSL